MKSIDARIADRLNEIGFPPELNDTTKDDLGAVVCAKAILVTVSKPPANKTEGFDYLVVNPRCGHGRILRKLLKKIGQPA